MMQRFFYRKLDEVKEPLLANFKMPKENPNGGPLLLELQQIIISYLIDTDFEKFLEAKKVLKDLITPVDQAFMHALRPTFEASRLTKLYFETKQAGQKEHNCLQDLFIKDAFSQYLFELPLQVEFLINIYENFSNVDGTRSLKNSPNKRHYELFKEKINTTITLTNGNYSPLPVIQELLWKHLSKYLCMTLEKAFNTMNDVTSLSYPEDKKTISTELTEHKIQILDYDNEARQERQKTRRKLIARDRCFAPKAFLHILLGFLLSVSGVIVKDNTDNKACDVLSYIMFAGGVIYSIFFTVTGIKQDYQTRTRGTLNNELSDNFLRLEQEFKNEDVTDSQLQTIHLGP